MANYYTQATLSPPGVHLTAEQKAWLEASGATQELQEKPSPLKELAKAAKGGGSGNSAWYVVWGGQSGF